MRVPIWAHIHAERKKMGMEKYKNMSPEQQKKFNISSKHKIMMQIKAMEKAQAKKEKSSGINTTNIGTRRNS